MSQSAISSTSATDPERQTPETKLEGEDFQLKADEASIQGAEIPRKPLGAYWTVMCLCLMIAFGGFVFGWDTGTISGFVAQTDFKRRFGQRHSDGT